MQQKDHKVPKRVGSNIKEFNNGQSVLVRDYREGRSQTIENVTAKTGPLSYQVDVNCSTWRRHVDQMKNTVLHDDSSEPIPPVYVPKIFFTKGHHFTRTACCSRQINQVATCRSSSTVSCRTPRTVAKVHHVVIYNGFENQLRNSTCENIHLMSITVSVVSSQIGTNWYLCSYQY